MPQICNHVVKGLKTLQQKMQNKDAEIEELRRRLRKTNIRWAEQKFISKSRLKAIECLEEQNKRLRSENRRLLYHMEQIDRSNKKRKLDEKLQEQIRYEKAITWLNKSIINNPQISHKTQG